MRLEFDYLKIEGFRSFAGKPVTLDFRHYRAGLHYVRGRNEANPRLGPNGVGKSSLWDALVWVLYGRTIEGLHTPDIRPWFGTAKTHVELQFRCDDKINKVVRSRVHSKNSLTLNGKLCGQSEIERCVGMPFDTFTNTIVYGQEQDLLLDLTPSRQMDMFEAVCHLDRWDERAKRASDAATALEVDYDKTDHERTACLAESELVEKQIKDLQARIAEWRETQKREEDKLNDRCDKAQGIVDKLEGIRGEYDLAYDSAMTELRALDNQLRKEETAYQTVQRQIRELDMAISSPSKCPTCGQDIKGHAAHVRKLQTRRAPIEKQKQELQKRCERLNKAHEELTKKANQAEADLNYTRNELANANALLKLTKDKLQERTVNPYREQLQDTSRLHDQIRDELIGLDKTLRMTKRKIERRLFWAKAFKDLRLEIVQDVLRELELTANILLAELGMGDWQIKFAIEKETKSGTIRREMNVTILSPYNDKAVNWHCWSSGEKQRLRIIGSLAFGQVLLSHAGVETPLRVFDEPTVRLSDVGIEDMVEMLAEHARMTKDQIFYIDHRVIESSRFASVTTVTRTKQGSIIQQ